MSIIIFVDHVQASLHVILPLSKEAKLVIMLKYSLHEKRDDLCQNQSPSSVNTFIVVNQVQAALHVKLLLSQQAKLVIMLKGLLQKKSDDLS